VQSFDQTFDNMNKALLISCKEGLPLRVVRSFKEKRSNYAPSQVRKREHAGRATRPWDGGQAQAAYPSLSIMVMLRLRHVCV
jgi:hypothetical protein